VTKAELVLNRGLLKSCRISGHAGAGPKGSDIVCAAVSVLARTAYTVLSGRNGITIQGGSPERGEFWLDITALSLKDNEFLCGVGNYLIEGLLSVSKEYPDYCKVTVEEIL
jgi:uncharacterized protein YsxB (DUF464 family)